MGSTLSTHVYKPHPLSLGYSKTIHSQTSSTTIQSPNPQTKKFTKAPTSQNIHITKVPIRKLLQAISMAFKLASLAFAAALFVSTSAVPTPEILTRQNGYACQPSQNAAGRKATLLSLGASVTDLAISIQETSCGFSADYPYGDDYPGPDGGDDGTPKTGDAANFGLFKNNWKQIRTYCTQFMNQTSAQWNNGAALNMDDQAAITCQHQQMNALGNGFWAAQRGCDNGDQYQSNIQLIENYLNAGNLNNDMVISPELQNC